eukprot:4987792-Pleurochrysis_carterae.AAC.1
MESVAESVARTETVAEPVGVVAHHLAGREVGDRRGLGRLRCARRDSPQRRLEGSAASLPSQTAQTERIA